VAFADLHSAIAWYRRPQPPEPLTVAELDEREQALHEERERERARRDERARRGGRARLSGR
jgi:hypothetical protein